MAAAKKVVPLPEKKKPQAPQPEPIEEGAQRAEETFLDRTAHLCRHITAAGGIEDVSELHDTTLHLLNQIEALFEGIFQIVENAASGDERLLALCLLGEDLAEEAKRRVDGLYVRG